MLYIKRKELLSISTGVYLNVNAETTEYMFMFSHHRVGQNPSIKM